MSLQTVLISVPKMRSSKILRNLAKEGAAVIVISSEMQEVLSISDRLMVMRRGRVSGFLDNKDLTQETIMKFSIA